MTVMNYDKIRKQTMANSYDRNIKNTEGSRKFENYLKQVNDDRNFDKTVFDDGAQYYNMGGLLENLMDSRRYNMSFIKGYEHARRLAIIEKKNKTR